MKKNETMGYVAYAMMLAIALIVALVVIRPLITDTTTDQLPMNSYLFVFLIVIVSIIVNALFVELGHLLGAKMGHYTIDSWICLGMGVKRQKDGKMKFAFSDFDGLTGFTAIVPTDIKKSNPRHSIYMPLAFFFLEVVASVVMIILGRIMAFEKAPSLEIAGVLLMTISGMIYLYDIFPAAVDGANDGYLMTILNNQTNIEAYNQVLLQQHQLYLGEKTGNLQVYESVTDFTVAINAVSIASALSKGDYEKALEINEKTIACKAKVSSGVYEEAVAQKTAIYFLCRPLEEAKEFFIGLPLEDKKHIAGLSTIVCVRAYVLASGLAEESVIETEAALEKADRTLNKLPKSQVDLERRLLSLSLEKVAAAHKDWDLSDYNYLRVDVKTDETEKAPEASATDEKEDIKK
jgi:hypothetical protein